MHFLMCNEKADRHVASPLTNTNKHSTPTFDDGVCLRKAQDEQIIAKKYLVFFSKGSEVHNNNNNNNNNNIRAPMT
jgi:hypothetical protein